MSTLLSVVKKPRASIRGKKLPPKLPPNHCRQIIVIDSAPIREKARKAYNKACRDLERLRAQVDEYHQKDLPAFTRWLHLRFGPLMTELREAVLLLKEREQFILQIDSLSLMEGISPVAAYEDVLRARENPEPVPPREDQADKGGRGRQSDEFNEAEAFEEDDPDDFDEFFKAVFNELTGTAPRDDAANPRLKTVYRLLVRKLHPDAQAELTPRKRELWHEVQIAYENGDVEQLEMLLSVCEMDEGSPHETSVSLLARLTTRMRSSLNAVRREIAQFRKMPAWNFSKVENLAGMERRMEGDLKAELRQVKDEIALIEAELQSLSEKSARRQASKAQGAEEIGPGKQFSRRSFRLTKVPVSSLP